MKATGIVRKIDELGRVVIPMELRRVLDINERDGMEFYVEDEKIILLKYNPAGVCMICSGAKNVREINGKHICTDCCVAAINGEDF